MLADAAEDDDRGLVLPVYPATEGLSHRQIRALIHQHLDALLALVVDPHPPGAARGARAARPADRARRRAPAGERGRGRTGPPAPRLRRAVRSAAGAGAGPDAGEAGAGRHSLRAQEGVDHAAQGAPPLRADRRPAAGGARGGGRHDRAAAHAPPAHGGRRDREDGGGVVRDAARGRERLPGRDHGADRAARRAAPRHAHPPAGAASDPARPVERPARRRRQGGGAAPPRLGCVAHRGGNARADPGIRHVSPPGPRGDRRATPLWGGAAGGAGRKG